MRTVGLAWFDRHRRLPCLGFKTANSSDGAWELMGPKGPDERGTSVRFVVRRLQVGEGTGRSVASAVSGHDEIIAGFSKLRCQAELIHKPFPSCCREILRIGHTKIRSRRNGLGPSPQPSPTKNIPSLPYPPAIGDPIHTKPTKATVLKAEVAFSTGEDPGSPTHGD